MLSFSIFVNSILNHNGIYNEEYPYLSLITCMVNDWLLHSKRLFFCPFELIDSCYYKNIDMILGIYMTAIWSRKCLNPF